MKREMKWSETVGWAIFPILIQMAIDRQSPITYGELVDKAEEVGVEFKTAHRGVRARSMRWPLGWVLERLSEYREESGIDIPHLTTIVVSQKNGQPTYFSKEFGWSDDKIQAEQAAVYNFEQWEHIRQAILRD